jgi:penicillin amidase
VSHETLKARGGSEERIEVTETHHGPVIAGEPARGWGITLADPGSSMATKWVDSAYQVMKSKSAAELDLAFDEWTDRTNNYPHADTQGNFGYVLKGRFPVRHRANGWGPVPGWTGDHDWQGMVPPDKLPKTQNPREGWVVTCNQRTVDEKYPYYISNAWAPEYRARRIVERIAVVRAGGQKMDVGRMAAIHGERVSMPGRVFARAAKGLKVNGALAARARDLLATWDGSMDRESAGAAVYSAVAAETLAALARHHYGRFAEEALTVEGGGGSVHINRYLKPLMADGLARDDRSLLPPGQTWQTLLAASVERAAARLEKELGADVAKWSWGRLHHTAHRHPLSASFPDAAPLLDPPQVATHGDGETPCNGSHGALTFTHAAGPVNRYVHDPSDWRNSKWVVPLGASGHAGSKHYADQQKLWADVEYVPMLWDFEQIAREAESAQRLVPG